MHKTIAEQGDNVHRSRYAL